MLFQTTKTKLLATAMASCLLITACNDSPKSKPTVGPAPIPATYQADIVWTQYGIPHITADDYGSLGYGSGYAYAMENYCTVMREYVFAAGESARYWGDEGDLESDLVMALYNSDDAIARMIAEDLPEFIVENLTGFAAGINRYFNETGADNLAQGEEGCRGEDWVRTVDVNDVVRLIHRTVLRASGGPLSGFIVAATPDEPMAKLTVPEGMQAAQMMVASLSQEAFDEGLPMPKGGALGSNAYAVGEQASQTNSGVLFGNPHFPWAGQERFFMSHVTLGDEYDVMGAALGGLPVPVIGFNRDVAWSHTVSTGSRFTFYELELNPDNRMQYVYDGGMRDITSQTVNVQNMTADGALEDIEHTFYFSHFGAIVNLGSINALLSGWPNANGSVLTYRDGNLENLRGLEQWVNMGKATDLEEFKASLADLGIPWVNTIAADRDGNAFYGDISVVPNVSSAQIQNCVRGILQSAVTGFGFLTMDGSDSACEWGNDPDTAPGLFSADNLPSLTTRDYGANANDSYWLSNPRMLLEGFSSIIGEEGIAQSLRTRATFDQAEKRIAGTDGLGDPGFNIDNIRTLHYQATNYTAELVMDEIEAICSAVSDWAPYSATPATVAQACAVLGDWDRAHLVDSVGAHVFYEFWQRASGIAGLWAVPFDAADPVNTPRDINDADTDVVEAIRQALADGVERLITAGIPMDRPWGEVQFDERNGERIGIHGGSSSMMFSVITSSLVDGEGYSNIRHGNSYMHAVTWDETDCPDAYGMLTYSQSTDPMSDHYADLTELYSQGGWVDMPFCEADRDAQEIRSATISE